MANIGGGRALQICDLCGGVDDHPRHQLAGGIPGVYEQPAPEIVTRVVQNAPEDQRDRLIAELLDTGTTSRHLDCCRTAGCPGDSCDERTAGAERLRGGDLLNHLMGA